MNIFISAAVMLALAMPCCGSQAAPVALAPQVARTSALYTVSGILQSKANGATIRLIQALAYGPTREDALAECSRDVIAKYPTYTLIDTVAIPLVLPKPACGQSI
jgi:hypothetical protein